MMEILGVSSEGAELIRKLAKNVDNVEKLEAIVNEHCPKTASYVRQMHASPYDSHMWRVTVALDAMNHILGTHGVEGLGSGSGPSYAPPYEYLNAGDPYSATLIYKRSSDTLSIGNWGDIAERHPEWE